jgi:multidrug efflux pump
VSFSTPFIKRPIATTLLSVALMLAGILAYFQLPVAPIPRVDYPVIAVSASLPGASPETMASSVATPLERQFGRIAGVNEMTSVSQLGTTSIVMQFDLDRDIDGAARDVQAAINAARSNLPADLPSNPQYRKVNPADAPILILSLTSTAMPISKVYDVGDSILAQRLSQIEGVGQVFVGGSSPPAVRIEANPMQLNALGIGLDQLRTAITAANVNRPKGSVSSAHRNWTITANDQLKTADQYRPLIVAYSNGAPVRLDQVSDVQDSLQDINNAGAINGQPAVLIIVFRQPGANIIATVDRVKAELPLLQASIPPSVHLGVALDRTTTIRASVHDVQWTLAISVSLVVMVVFLFLRDARSTFIPSIAVPLAILGTFGVMYLLHYSIDNLSLMAVTICTGFVVDDAIVVLENIMRHIEAGMRPLDASLLGAKEIGFTVVSISISLVAVFIPILLMGGLVGRLFREFAVTLSAAILVSMVVSLTTTPMLCAKLLKAHTEAKGRIYNWTEDFFVFINRIYRAILIWVLRHRAWALAITILILVLNVVLYIIVPKGFFPQQDTGRLMGTIIADQDIGFPALKQKVQQYAAIVKADPAVENVIAFAGGGMNSSNSGRMFVTLKPLDQRKGVSADMVLNRLRQKLARIPGANLYLQSVQELQIGGRFGAAQFQYTLQSEDLKTLDEWAPKLLAKLRTVPQFKDVNSDQQNQGLEVNVVIDRDTASRLGVTASQIDNALYDAFGQRLVSTIYQPLNQYHVVLEADPRYRDNPDTLKNIYVRSNTGQQIPLATFVHFQSVRTALAVNHQGQFPAVTLSFNLAPGVSLGQATAILPNIEREIGMPAIVHGSFQGTAAVFQSSLASEPLLILTALVAVYIVLGVLYESYIHPITILSTLPSAGLGALLALLVTKTELSIIALIGIVLLIGIVKKNAIMMIDFALDAERKRGKTSEESIFEAALMRFRPITMTTMAALLGAVPLAVGTGTGSEIRRPLGISIVGGLIVSQMVTLFSTPVIYLYLDRVQAWWTRRHSVKTSGRLPDVSPSSH